MGTSYNPKIVTDGLVLNLDAGNKKSYPGAGNNWYDLSTRKNHCSLYGGTAAFSNGGIYFDPTVATSWRGSDSGFSMGTNPSTQIVWCRPAIITQNRIITYYGTSLTNQSRGMEILANSNYRFLGFLSDLNSNLNFSLNSWHMVVGVFNSTNQLTYLNDKTGATGSTATYNWNTVSAGYYTIGGDTIGFSGRTWNGNISIVQFYNRALSYAEILQNYNAMKGRFGL